MSTGNTRQVRIKDIAAKAGVSVGTVDRVLHNRGNVSAKARIKVNEALDAMNYQPNIVARTLANNREFRIGLCMPDPRLDEYWRIIYQGVQNAVSTLKHYGVSVVPFFFDDRDKGSLLESGQELKRSTVDAVLSALVFKEEGLMVLDWLHEMNIPCALINTNVAESHAKLCYIGQDSYRAGVLAASLLNRFVRRGDRIFILHFEVGSEDATHLVEKERGFQDHFKTHRNIWIETVRLDPYSDSEALAARLRAIIQPNSDIHGIFVTTSKAYKVVEALGAERLEDIHVVGFDLISQNVHYLEEGLIDFLINQNPHRQGYMGVTHLVNHLVLNADIPKYSFLPLDIVVPENLEYYLNIERGVNAIH